MTRETLSDPPVKSTAEGQKRMARSALERSMEAIKTFHDIQMGPNPLSREDVQRLAERNPETWGQFAAIASLKTRRWQL